MERNRYLEKVETKTLIEETCTLLQHCWDRGFGIRQFASVLEVLMYECEARGIEFIPKDEGLVIRLKKSEPIRARDYVGIPIPKKESGRWDGK